MRKRWAVAALLLAGPLVAPARGGAATPFRTYRPDPALVAGTGAGEPTLGIDPRTGAVLVQAMTRTLRLSTDGTWSEVTPPTQRGLVTLDPILETDRATGRTFVSQLLGACGLLAYTEDAGRTWKDSPMGCGPGAVADHQSVGVGPFRAGAPVGRRGTYPNAVYYCAHDNLTANCALSTDGGDTFLPAVPAWAAARCDATHGQVTVAPDGTVYVPPLGCIDGTASVGISEDNGLTWRMSSVPGTVQEGSGGYPSVGVGARGTAYLAWSGGGGGDPVPHVSVTRDRGRTWTRPVVLGRDAGVVNATFLTTVVGDDDRAAVAFLGSRTAGEGTAESFPGTWSLFVSTTYDGGRTWRTVDAGGRPVHRGGICMGGLTCTAASRVLLDFADAVLDPAGRVVAVVAVSCRDAACRTATAETKDTVPMVARQVGGVPLRRVPAR